MTPPCGRDAPAGRGPGASGDQQPLSGGNRRGGLTAFAASLGHPGIPHREVRNAEECPVDLADFAGNGFEPRWC